MSSHDEDEKFGDGTIPGFGAQGQSPLEHQFEGRPQPPITLRSAEIPIPSAPEDVKSSSRIAMDDPAGGDTDGQQKRTGLRALFARLFSRS